MCPHSIRQTSPAVCIIPLVVIPESHLYLRRTTPSLSSRASSAAAATAAAGQQRDAC